jgi:hypothetical protein
MRRRREAEPLTFGELGLVPGSNEKSAPRQQSKTKGVSSCRAWMFTQALVGWATRRQRTRTGAGS